MNNLNDIFEKNNYLTIPNYTPTISSKTKLLKERENLYKTIRDKTNVVIDFSKEIKRPNNDKFFIMKCPKKEQIELFINYIQFYLIDSYYYQQHLTVGIDCEFITDLTLPQKRRIALMQLSFYPHRKFKYIFIIEPTEKYFTEKQMNIIIKAIFTSPLKRITHGSDSLDIPYFFEILLQNDKTKIKQFIKQLYDTRFLCEYYKIKTKHLDRKCDIYVSYTFFDVITAEQSKQLEDNVIKMGPIQDVNWNVALMDTFRTRYAACDVLYLKELIMQILNRNIDGMNYIPIYARYIIYEKYGLLNLLEITKTQVDPINNYIVGKHNATTMNKSFKEFLLVHEEDYPILFINYFKTIFMYLFKFMFYSLLQQKYPIYQKKNIQFKTKLDKHNIFEPLRKNGFNIVVKLLLEFNDVASNFINNKKY